jgi:phosphoribosylformylglycinamidine cyclo-ligase
MRYRDAGVDIGRADALKDDIGRAVRATWTPAVRSLPGGFAGIMGWPAGSGAPLMAATMDGVGTKLHVGIAAGRVGDAAADLVYHGANDLLAHGARPLAFLDYVAQARLDAAVLREVVSGLARACAEVGAVLLGGETAEMPDTYLEGVVDVAGCMIGAVAIDRVLDGSAVREGDVVLGLASEGLHTNGFSLARRVVAAAGLELDAPLPGGDRSVGEALLAPHRWYGRSVLPLAEAGRLKAIAHVTGGGIAGNLVRVLPEGARAIIDPGAWPLPPLFRWLCTAGSVPDDDARQAFNMGIGLAIVCGPGAAGGIEAGLRAAGETVFRIGAVTAGPREVVWNDR